MAGLHTLVVDIGNTTVFAGVYVGNRLVRHFRLASEEARRRGAWARLAAARVGRPVHRLALCSVVPELTPVIAGAMDRIFGVRPTILRAAAPHGLKIGYRRPQALGADRLACALGARVLFPRRNVLVVDCGTATTVTALHRDGTVLGGAILPGIALWPAMLAGRTAQLPRIRVARPRRALGRTPAEAIRSGNFHGHAGAIREVVDRVRTEAFGRSAVVIVGTGGHAPLFKREKLFTVFRPDLILTGLHAFAQRLPAHA